ncbi:hypothetical protein RJ640_026902 [Escallonia rubra]|uniref:Cytokinin riboside 5'-monophosphate phosphoribohydrolase n=1 Tax=Escallonia rubra TaxID=112253 RepID=A0AA88RPF1_9ASTE|nr:hypothetical protein RJ640_026902 [Escallonia rubra]
MEEEKVVTNSRFRRVCVFCGSSSGKRDCYRDAAIELGQELVSKRLDLVYGGGGIGLMGLVSKAVHSGGGHDHTQSFDGQRVLTLLTFGRTQKTGDTVGEVKPVAGMHQRKAEMARHSDCFIALPGGYGTLEELLEVIAWAQLGIHDKPVGLLNVDGYYNNLLTFIDKAVDDGFIKPSQRHIFVSAPNAKELVQKLEVGQLETSGSLSFLSFFFLPFSLGKNYEFCFDHQEYVPVHDEVIAKLNWEVEQQSTSPPAAVEVVGFKSLQTEIAL